MSRDFLRDDDSLDAEQFRQWTQEQGKPGWIFDFPKPVADFFEGLPERFTFDELMDEAERQGIPSEEAAKYLRIMQREEMLISIKVNQWQKNEEARPYF